MTEVSETWNKAYRLCKNYILNTLSNDLFDVYCHHVHAKDICDALYKEYLSNYENSKKYVVGYFLKF